MNKFVKELIDTLRSGEVKQCSKVLGKPDGSRCCLGVASDIAVKYGVIPAPTEELWQAANGNYEPVLTYGGAPFTPEARADGTVSQTALVDKVRTLFGFSSSLGVYTTGEQTFSNSTLTSKNDSGKTFAEIADIIEKAPQGLFKELTPVQELVNRLRSGAVRQGKFNLGTTSGERCCLGVACDIAVERGVILEPKASGASLIYDDASTTSLPIRVREFFGFSDAGGLFYPNGKDKMASSLVALNDSGGKTFAEIADVIESRPEGLFTT